MKYLFFKQTFTSNLGIPDANLRMVYTISLSPDGTMIEFHDNFERRFNGVVNSNY